MTVEAKIAAATRVVKAPVPYNFGSRHPRDGPRW
jgi:hypothetical protein